MNRSSGDLGRLWRKKREFQIGIVTVQDLALGPDEIEATEAERERGGMLEYLEPT
jgi:hypothetical protein